MMLDLHLDHKNGMSLYQQLVQQIKSAILTKRLLPGEQLPSVRELAKNVDLNPLTVAKAYATLEQQKFVDTKWGKGSFVADTLPASKGSSAHAHLRTLVEQFLAEALPLARSPQELIGIIKDTLQQK